MLLFAISLFLPSVVSGSPVDEFKGELPGYLAALGALYALLNVPHLASHLLESLAGIVNPLTAFYLLRSRRSLDFPPAKHQAVLVVMIFLGLSASAGLMIEGRYLPRVGYFAWVVSVLLMVSPEIVRFVQTRITRTAIR